MDIIFTEQHDKVLFSMGQGVKPIFVIKKGKAIGGDRIISGNPILSSIECLNDVLSHRYVRQYMEKYQNNLMNAYIWIKKSLRKDDTTGNLLGWFGEHGDEHIPKSWITGHYLLFIKYYCDFLSSMIEKQTNKDLNVTLVNDINAIRWSELGDSYNNKKFLELMLQYENDRWASNPKYASALLYGPPGTGKSTIAKSLAKKLNWNYVEIVPGMFLSEGESNIIPNINSIFKRLMRLENTIIFFDEVDQLVENRETSTPSSRWIVTSMLPKFQERRNKEDIKFIMATNNVKNVDRAIMRGGRIDFVIPMGNLSWKSRLKMLRASLIDKNNSPSINTKYSNLSKGVLDGLIVDAKFISAIEIEKLGRPDIKGQYLINYLTRTDFVLLPDLINILKLFQSSNWAEDPLFKIFFEGVDLEHSKYVNYENTEYITFHRNDPTQLIKTTPEIRHTLNIKQIYNDNIFRPKESVLGENVRHERKLRQLNRPKGMRPNNIN